MSLVSLSKRQKIEFKIFSLNEISLFSLLTDMFSNNFWMGHLNKCHELLCSLIYDQSCVVSLRKTLSRTRYTRTGH